MYIRKKLLGFGWIPLDPGNRRWKKEGRSSHRSINCFLSCFSATLGKGREDGTAGEGAGGLFYRAGALRS